MFRSVSLHKPRPGVLIVRKSRTSSALALLGYTLFYTFWYSMLIGMGSDRFLWLFYLAPLFALPSILRSLNVMFQGESHTFDSTAGAILKNDSHFGAFSDVDRVQIRTIHDSEGSDDYRLSVVMRDETKLMIEQSTRYEEICEIADDIADLMDVEVVRKK